NFFFQAEDGIRDRNVTGVQTCALPISFNFVSAVSYPMMFGLAAISLTLAPKYYGSGYGPVGPAMMIESIVILIIAWSNVLGVQYLLPIHIQKQFTRSVTFGDVVNLIVHVPLIRIWRLNRDM